MIDLLVAGAGPAGLASAAYAAEAGLEVLVLDPRTGPIDKACGEGLMPGAVRALTDLGVGLDGHEFHGIRYCDGRRSATARFRAGVGLGVRRTTLQAALRQRAADLGVRFEQRAITDLLTGERISVGGGLSARYLIAADGLHSPLRRAVGLQLTSRAPARFGLRQHFRLPPWADVVEVHWAADAEAYVTPVGPDEVGVAVLGGPRASLAQQLQAFPALLDRLGGAEPISKVMGAGPLRQRTRARVAGRVLLVGDAAGYVDALTGEGIAVALACARSAVAAVVADRPQDYERAWRRDTRTYRLITQTLLTTRRVAGRAIVPAASALPGVFRAAVNQLAG